MIRHVVTLGFGFGPDGAIWVPTLGFGGQVPEYTVAFTAGLVLGAATPRSPVTGGGLVLGGSIPYTPATSAGLVLGGASVTDASLTITAGGGLVLGGTQPVLIAFPVVGSGGVVLGGVSIQPGGQLIATPAGGLVLGGTTTTVVYQLSAASAGGVLIGSTFIVAEVVIIPLIAANPGSQALSTTATITIVGQNTTFVDTPPVFSISGVAGTSITGGSMVVIDQTHATIEIVTGTTIGTATIADATSGASTPFVVKPPAPRLVYRRPELVRRRNR